MRPPLSHVHTTKDSYEERRILSTPSVGVTSDRIHVTGSRKLFGVRRDRHPS
jgi:hypothetical protein